MLNPDPATKQQSLLYRIVTNPVLLGVVGIIGFLVSIYSLFLDKEAEPVYRVLSDVVITERGSTSKIKVYYDSLEVENVRAVTIALWNAGDAFLDKSAFSKDKPIAIQCYSPISLLDVKLIKKSRVDLNFRSTTIAGTPAVTTPKALKYDYVKLEIEGDEGLEAGDGATYTILYTTKAKSCHWFVKARIKGVPRGFKRAIDNKEFSTAIVTSGISIAILIGVIFYTYKNRNTMRLVLQLIVYIYLSMGVLYYIFRIVPYYLRPIGPPTDLIP